jgi:Flp pilus assembly protein TadD
MVEKVCFRGLSRRHRNIAQSRCQSAQGALDWWLDRCPRISRSLMRPPSQPALPQDLAEARAALRAQLPERAAELCLARLAQQPGEAETLEILAAAFLALDRPEAALEAAEAARRTEPDKVDLITLSGRILAKLERYEDAAAEHEAALKLAPDRPDVITNLGMALFELDRFGPALELFRRAFRLAPQDARVVANLGNFLDFAGTLDLSLAAYEAAASLSPEDREIRSNHGMALLRAGRLEQGWPLFESRRRLRDPVEDTGVPRLPAVDSVDLRGRRVLVFHEQGFGDSLQFSRYVPLLAERGAEVLLRMPPALALLGAGIEGVARLLAADELPALDFWSPMMSLPTVFGTTLDTIPARIPYLHPPAEALRRWQAALAGLARPRIGLVWAGSPRGGLDRRRSVSFEVLRPLFRHRAAFVSLQLGPAAAQWAPPPGAETLDPTAGLTDFAETAALVASLDLVITVDTSVAHVAGAVGTPVWVMSRFASCWRWLMRREDSPWYPSLRLFRQARPGDWSELVARVDVALDHFCGSGQGGP